MAELVEITLTRDRFESEILAEAVRAEGYQVELNGPSEQGSFETPSGLLVHAADVDAIMAIISRSQTES